MKASRNIQAIFSRKRVIALFVMSIMVLSIVLLVNSSQATQADLSQAPSGLRTTTESYLLESDHPYSNYFDHTWEITKPGATKIRAHFTYIEVEKNYDYVYVYDYAGSQLHKLTGTYSSGGWTAYSNGDTIKIRLKTDYSVTKWGFKIDQIEYEGGSSGGGGTTDHELTNGQTVSSSLSGTGATETWTIQVDANAVSMHSVLTCGSNDYDLYGRLGAEPTTSTYDWRGYTTGGEDVTYDNPGQGTWYIMVRSYSGSGAYDLTVTVTYDNGGGSSSWGNGGKYAIVIGISDYQYINDLQYADDDAADWYYFLTNQGYEVHVYGDSHTSNYPRYDGLATEANVRAAIQELAAHAQAGDKVVITSSGHGGADETNGWYYSGGGETNDVTSFLCMVDSNGGTTGNYYENEIVADLNQFQAGVQITLVYDHCHSGGIGPNIMASNNAAYILVLTTASGNGYGYDESDHQNGKFTYWLLQGFQNGGQTTWEGDFNWIMVSGRYLPVDNAADNPQIFDGNTNTNYSV